MYATLRITKAGRDTLRKASLKAGKPMGDYAIQCVVYASTLGYDPYDTQQVELVEEFKKLRKSLIGFIREQEKKYIIPNYQRTNETARTLVLMKSSFEDLLAHLLETNEPNEAMPETIGDKKSKLLEEELSLKSAQLDQAIRTINLIEGKTAYGRKKCTVSIGGEELKAMLGQGQSMFKTI